MPRVQLPNGFEGVEDLPRTRRSLQNCFNNGRGSLIPRPGIEQLNTTGGVARGQFVWNGALYQIVSTDLIKITDVLTGAFTVIGTIAGEADIVSDFSFTETTIAVKAVDGTTYVLDSSDTLTEITNNPNMAPARAVAQINGRIVYIPFDGSPAFFSNIGDAGAIEVLSFFDAEELPDKNSTVFNFKNTLYIGGTDSFELFRDSGATPNPFIRINGARVTNGFVSGLLEYNETFLFVGREANQDFGIYAIGQGRAPKISNEAVDLILAGYTQDELDNVTSARFKWRGYDIATFTFARDSFGFIGGNWFILDTVFSGVSRPWAGGFINEFEGIYYTAFSDKIGKLSKVNTDYGERVTRLIDTAFESENNDWFSVQNVDLGIAQGFNSGDGSVFLQISRDNVTYGPPVARRLGATGNYADHLQWNPGGGMGRFDGFMGIRIMTTEDVFFSVNHLIVNNG